MKGRSCTVHESSPTYIRKFFKVSKMTNKSVLINSGNEFILETFEPSGDAYYEDVMTPVFSWTKKAYTAEQLVCILLGKYREEHLCVSQPLSISNNVTFLVEMGCLNHPDDIKCDDMGSWKHNGSPKQYFRVLKTRKGIENIEPIKSKPSDEQQNIYELRRIYYINQSDPTIRKLVAKLVGMYCSRQNFRHLQFSFIQ